MDFELIRQKLTNAGLKVTPQRMAILEAIFELNNHPNAENIVGFIRKNHPNISTATVYKVLDALVENHIIRRVKTDSDVMRYDGIMDKHHHLYCAQTDRIEDYADEDLDLILANHFRKKGIDGFKIEDIRLQIVGKFTG
jgi:Fur family transcriptional regulator, peroxide stress response regulator